MASTNPTHHQSTDVTAKMKSTSLKPPTTTTTSTNVADSNSSTAATVDSSSSLRHRRPISEPVSSSSSSSSPSSSTYNPPVARRVPPSLSPSASREGTSSRAVLEFTLLFLFLLLIVMTACLYLFTTLNPHPHHHHASRGERKMRDTHVTLPVTLEDLYHGRVMEISYPSAQGRQTLCSHCSGTGGDPTHSHSVQPCSVCSGHGVQHVRRQLMPGFVQTFQQTCQSCGGAGSKIVKPCPRCKGSGLIMDRSATLQALIPVGASDGHVITLRGAGDQPALREHADAGDVLVTLRTQKHAVFQRRAANATTLHVHMPITLREALLGFTRNLTLLSGAIHMIHHSLEDNPIQPGASLTLHGLGLPAYDDRRTSHQLLRIEHQSRAHTSVDRYITQPFTDALEYLQTLTSGTGKRGDIIIEFDIRFPTDKKKAFSEKQKSELKELFK